MGWSSFWISVLCFFFVYLRSVSCVPNVTCVSGLFFLDCPFCFLVSIFYICPLLAGNELLENIEITPMIVVV
jgi:hypothetical protein